MDSILGFPGGLVVKNPLANTGGTRDRCLIPGWDSPLQKEMATHSSILTWRMPWADKPGGLQSMGSWGCKESDTTEHTHTDSILLLGTCVCVCVCVCVSWLFLLSYWS